MFYNINQPCTPYFPIGLVKTKSAFIFRSVETGLGRWLLVVAVISELILILFWLSQTWLVTLRMSEKVFSDCTVLPDSKETKLGSSNQEASPSAGKNTGVVLVPCSRMEVRPYSYFWWCGYFWGPWVSFSMTDEFSVRVTKITSRIGVSWTQQPTVKFCNLFLTQWIMAILLKGCKPDNFEPHNFLKLSFANTWGLCSNFAEFESFLESNSSDILALCEANLDDSIDSSSFSVRVYLRLIQKESVTHMHGLAVYVKEVLPLHGTL